MSNKKSHIKHYFLSIIIPILFLFTNCKDNDDIIPQKHFSCVLKNINTSPKYLQSNPFIVDQDSYKNTIGIRGVVVCMIASNQYYVFDRMCPYEKSKNSLINISENGINCTCPTCKSEFMIFSEYSSVLKGPSKWPLKKYKCEVRNNNLYIWN